MTSLAHFEAVAGSLKLPGEAVIGGKTVRSASVKTFANVTPRNGRDLNHVAQCEMLHTSIPHYSYIICFFFFSMFY